MVIPHRGQWPQTKYSVASFNQMSNALPANASTLAKFYFQFCLHQVKTLCLKEHAALVSSGSPNGQKTVENNAG